MDGELELLNAALSNQDFRLSRLIEYVESAAELHDCDVHWRPVYSILNASYMPVLPVDLRSQEVVVKYAPMWHRS
jgi:hypothetical protein